MMAVSRPSILVADQDEQSRNRLTVALRGAGYEALPARSGGEAVAVARRQRVEISILDWSLPDLPGIETHRLITAVRGRVEAIFLDGERTKDTLVRLLDAGVYAVLHKPPELELLLETVRGLASRMQDQ